MLLPGHSKQELGFVAVVVIYHPFGHTGLPGDLAGGYPGQTVSAQETLRRFDEFLLCFIGHGPRVLSSAPAEPTMRDMPAMAALSVCSRILSRTLNQKSNQ